MDRINSLSVEQCKPLSTQTSTTLISNQEVLTNYFRKRSSMSAQLLNPPFRIDWQSNTNDVTEKVLHLLQNLASAVRPSTRLRKRGRRRRDRRKENSKKEAPISTESKGDDTKNKESAASDSKESGVVEQSSEIVQDSKSKMFKENAVIGVSKILRLLEQRMLSVVLFDRSFLRPSAIAQFIGSACIASGAHCACLDGLSARLAPFLNVKSASVVGIKKPVAGYPEPIESLVKAVRTWTKPVALASQTNEGDGGGRRKKRKRAVIDTSSDTKGEPASYIEATVLVQQRVKKKQK